MGEGRRRSARRACLAAAALCTALSLAAPARAQDDDTAPAPEVWRGAASASVATLEVERDALLPVEGVFRISALDGESAYETDRQTARASLLYPGEGVLQGPNLVCGTFGGQLPPELKPVLDACATYDYPLTVKADASAADRSTAGSVALGKPADAVSLTATGARAHAAADGASTDAVVKDLRLLGLPGIGVVSLLPLEELALDPTILTIASATSHTDQRIDHGALVVTAESRLSGIRLLGGLVDIASIRSRSSAGDDADGTRRAQASLEVGGVTVAGLPAQITEDGLVVGSPTGGLGPLQQQLQSALNQLVQVLNVRITLLGTEETLDDGTGQAVAAAGGVLVEVSLNADGAPTVPGPLGDIDLNGTYVGSIRLGNSGASAGATTFPALPPPADPTPAGGGDLPDGGGSPADFGAGGVDVVVPPVTEAAAPPAAAPGPTEVIRRLTDPFGGRLGLLYLAFSFAVLGLAVVPRMTLPARLPARLPAARS